MDAAEAIRSQFHRYLDLGGAHSPVLHGELVRHQHDVQHHSSRNRLYPIWKCGQVDLPLALYGNAARRSSGHYGIRQPRGRPGAHSLLLARRRLRPRAKFPRLG